MHFMLRRKCLETSKNLTHSVLRNATHCLEDAENEAKGIESRIDITNPVKQEVNKCWSDWKSKTKAKHAAIRRHALDSEGGPSKKLRLTPLEERVVELLRPESYKEDFYTSDEDNNGPCENVNYVFEMDGEATSSLEVPKQEEDNVSEIEGKSFPRTNEMSAHQNEVLPENYISSEEQHMRLESRKLELEEKKLKIEEMKVQLEQRRLMMEERNNEVRNTAITELVSVVRDLGDAFVGYLDSLQE